MLSANNGSVNVVNKEIVGLMDRLHQDMSATGILILEIREIGEFRGNSPAP